MNDVTQLTAEMYLTDIVRKYPATRKVLDRYGLQGCGGPGGPRETVAWFARLHGVPLARLLSELNEATTRTDSDPVTYSPSRADTIYRPFFTAGIVTVLTLGCTFGAINLLTIGLRQNFAAVNYSWILAHAHGMVFGFVGLFIMGFAYQALPGFKHTALWRPKLAFSSLPLMAVGLFSQTMGHLLVPLSPALILAIVGSVFQIAAVLVFATVIVKTTQHARKPEAHDRFVFAAIGWFIIAAVANPFVFKLFELPRDREQLLFNLSTFNIPYRDVQLLGIAVVMILGVSLRFLPHAYGFREPSRRWQAFLFWGVNGAILIGAISFLGGMSSGNHQLLTVQWLSSVVLLVIAIGTVNVYQIFGKVPPSERDRGLKFIRAAHVWFIIAMALLVCTPLYNFAIYMPLTGSRVPFSHAFFGGYRHALTVGFIMMMIVGVSSKVVPTLSGVEMSRASTLRLTFVLLNVGNALRVTTEIATDFVPGAYRIMGFSGFIEVVALALWGYELLRNMSFGRRLEVSATGQSFRSGPIGQVLTR